ncbi:MAG: 50S ribosomal protein L22 [Candidatus Moraniibacteriota bacterium]
MRVVAKLNNLRIAPRKVRLVTHSIVGLPVAAALVQLRRQVKRSSLPITVLLKSAIANAKNNFQLAEETLFVKEVRVLDGVRLKRFTPKAFGQATPILRRTSKIHIILDERAPKVVAKTTEKKVVTKTVTKKTVVKKTEPQASTK